MSPSQGPSHLGKQVTTLETLALKLGEQCGSRKGELYLLLGGIGSGKTTFLKRYQTLIAKSFLETQAFAFHLDFLKGPPRRIRPNGRFCLEYDFGHFA